MAALNNQYSFSLKVYCKGKNEKGDDLLEFELDLINSPDVQPPDPKLPKPFLHPDAFSNFKKAVTFIDSLYNFIIRGAKVNSKFEKEFDTICANNPEYNKQIETIRKMVTAMGTQGGIGRLAYERHNPSSLSIGFYTSLYGNGDGRPPGGEML